MVPASRPNRVYVKTSVAPAGRSPSPARSSGLEADARYVRLRAMQSRADG